MDCMASRLFKSVGLHELNVWLFGVWVFVHMVIYLMFMKNCGCARGITDNSVHHTWSMRMPV